MSPRPQPKSEELLEQLNDFIALGERNDILKYHLQDEFEKLIESDPVAAYTGLTFIAQRIDKDEKTMRKNFDMVLQHEKDNPIYLCNYAAGLAELGCVEEAKKKVQESMHFIDTCPKSLPAIAQIAYRLDYEEIFIDIIKKAEEHKLYSDFIGIMASKVMLANCDSEDEEIEILNKIFSDEHLEKNVTQLSNEEWEDIINLADELKEYE